MIGGGKGWRESVGGQIVIGRESVKVTDGSSIALLSESWGNVSTWWSQECRFIISHTRESFKQSIQLHRSDICAGDKIRGTCVKQWEIGRASCME